MYLGSVELRGPQAPCNARFNAPLCGVIFGGSRFMRGPRSRRRTARAATRLTLVRDLRRMLPEYLNNIRYLLRGQKVTEKPPR